MEEGQQNAGKSKDGMGRVVWTCQQFPYLEMLLSDLDKEGREAGWIKVPSQVTVDGNNEAD